MKIIWHEAFLEQYTDDPAAAAGRMESVLEALEAMDGIEWLTPEPATPEDLLRCHTEGQLERVEAKGFHEIAALSAGGAILAAEHSDEGPSFALIRPPGHHASPGSCWGFCFYSNLAVALVALHAQGKIRSAMALDFDMHYGDGTVNMLIGKAWVKTYNPDGTRQSYMDQVYKTIHKFEGDCIAFSAGFDNHKLDWGGLLETDDYRYIGHWAALRAKELGARVFGVLEGGYYHSVLGGNVRAFLEGMDAGWAGHPPPEFTE